MTYKPPPPTAYNIELGRNLRRTRVAQGLTLRDVTADSEGQFQAVTLGSYERGERAITMEKLAQLAAFYGVPAVGLMPLLRHVRDVAARAEAS